MRITDEDVAAFRMAYMAAYDVELPVDQAREMTLRTLTLYEALSRPLPEPGRFDA